VTPQATSTGPCRPQSPGRHGPVGPRPPCRHWPGG
jgi:hypothetical protein